MSSLPNEIFSDMTKFLPNDNITDLMLMSRNFNALVTPRLKKIDEEMATMNQSIGSFMPSPAPENDHEWIPQLNLKRFEPIGSKAKKRVKEVLENEKNLNENHVFDGMIDRLKEGMSLDRFDNISFLRILGALISTPKFRQEYNIPFELAYYFSLTLTLILDSRYDEFHDDVHRIWAFYSETPI
ncbi:hypothetical protein DdX_17273 [Ditylenchus destructor]|uniref:F-box domain-containing protein n=1 Tax=Ditylenchus destructor TaxID=166010 RepID=A0AAD4MNA9_9BILA|nr:hypothetical protein DdX_17273 [Ditylenchus destructor]